MLLLGGFQVGRGKEPTAQAAVNAHGIGGAFPAPGKGRRPLEVVSCRLPPFVGETEFSAFLYLAVQVLPVAEEQVGTGERKSGFAGYNWSAVSGSRWQHGRLPPVPGSGGEKGNIRYLNRPRQNSYRTRRYMRSRPLTRPVFKMEVPPRRGRR